MRRICLQSDIKCHLARNTILVDANDFISKINPDKIDKHFYTIPRLRCINGCVKEWNKQRQKGERYIHADEIRAFLKNDQTVFKYKFGNRHFWAEGYYVSTVGLNEATIKKYIQEQEKHDIAMDKLSVKEYEDPFKG